MMLLCGENECGEGETLFDPLNWLTSTEFFKAESCLPSISKSQTFLFELLMALLFTRFLCRHDFGSFILLAWSESLLSSHYHLANTKLDVKPCSNPAKTIYRLFRTQPYRDLLSATINLIVNSFDLNKATAPISTELSRIPWVEE